MHPSIRRAKETLARLDDAERREREERASRWALGYDNHAPDRPRDCLSWDAANPRGLTVATMSQEEFSAWCDAGRPPLKAQAQPTLDIEDFARFLGRQFGELERRVDDQIARLDRLVAQQVLDLRTITNPDWHCRIGRVRRKVRDAA